MSTPEDAPAPPEPRRSVPQGFRTGLITAITVLLGFSLAFFRFWGFEASGHWGLRSIVSTAAVVVAIVLQVIALFRSLRLEDDEEREYRKTVRWFIASVAALVLGLLFAVVEFAGGSDPH
jgi:NO-binding membrane sensor protein with MHYT domain